MKRYQKFALTLACCFTTSIAWASITVPMYMTAKTGVGKEVGTITAKNTPKGLLLTPNLRGLTPGMHGFHVHQNPSCGDMGMAAGGHLDPGKTGKHLGPYGKGHLGDMPPLVVNAKGEANTPVLAPRLKESDLPGHSLMIHVGGDNFSDNPPMGGGGARMVCGVIPAK